MNSKNNIQQTTVCRKEFQQTSLYLYCHISLVAEFTRDSNRYNENIYIKLIVIRLGQFLAWVGLTEANIVHCIYFRFINFYICSLTFGVVERFPIITATLQDFSYVAQGYFTVGSPF